MTATDSTLLALHRAVLTHPAEDMPRLAYADRLDEIAGDVVCPKCSGEGCSAHSIVANGPCKSVSDGRRERAELIRVQCELGSLKNLLVLKYNDPERLTELRRRERELLEAHRSTWTNIVPGYTIDAWPLDEPMLPYVYGARCRFSRGFIASLTLSAADWLRVADVVYWHPGQTVECQNRCFLSTVHLVRICKNSPGKRCDSCKDGRIPRPFVATAQPITTVTLSDGGFGAGFERGVSIEPGGRVWQFPAWPGITFHLASA